MNSLNSDTRMETLFLRNRHLLVLAIVVSIAAGLFAVAKLHRFEDPRITNLYPIIITPFPGCMTVKPGPANRPFFGVERLDRVDGDTVSFGTLTQIVENDPLIDPQFSRHSAAGVGGSAG